MKYYVFSVFVATAFKGVEQLDAIISASSAVSIRMGVTVIMVYMVCQHIHFFLKIVILFKRLRVDKENRVHFKEQLYWRVTTDQEGQTFFGNMILISWSCMIEFSLPVGSPRKLGTF